MQVRGAKTVRWMPSDGHSPYVGENGNWWQWNDKLQRYVDTGVSAKGVQGMPGQIPFQKEWKAGDTHRNDTNIVDYIYVRSADPNSRKWYKLKDTYVIRTVPSDETEPSADTLSTYYEEIPWMSELAINVLLVEEGNIANFIFKDGKLISVRGTVDGVGADYAGQANFVPNIVLDGKTGKVISNDSEVRGTVYAVDGEFSGKITGTSGKIAGFNIIGNALVSEYNRVETEGGIDYNVVGKLKLDGSTISILERATTEGYEGEYVYENELTYDYTGITIRTLRDDALTGRIERSLSINSEGIFRDGQKIL